MNPAGEFPFELLSRLAVLQEEHAYISPKAKYEQLKLFLLEAERADEFISFFRAFDVNPPLFQPYICTDKLFFLIWNRLGFCRILFLLATIWNAKPAKEEKVVTEKETDKEKEKKKEEEEEKKKKEEENNKEKEPDLEELKEYDVFAKVTHREHVLLSLVDVIVLIQFFGHIVKATPREQYEFEKRWIAALPSLLPQLCRFIQDHVKNMEDYCDMSKAQLVNVLVLKGYNEEEFEDSDDEFDQAMNIMHSRRSRLSQSLCKWSRIVFLLIWNDIKIRDVFPQLKENQREQRQKSQDRKKEEEQEKEKEKEEEQKKEKAQREENEKKEKKEEKEEKDKEHKKEQAELVVNWNTCVRNFFADLKPFGDRHYDMTGALLGEDVFRLSFSFFPSSSSCIHKTYDDFFGTSVRLDALKVLNEIPEFTRKKAADFMHVRLDFNFPCMPTLLSSSHPLQRMQANILAKKTIDGKWNDYLSKSTTFDFVFDSTRETKENCLVQVILKWLSFDQEQLEKLLSRSKYVDDQLNMTRDILAPLFASSISCASLFETNLISLIQEYLWIEANKAQNEALDQAFEHGSASLHSKLNFNLNPESSKSLPILFNDAMMKRQQLKKSMRLYRQTLVFALFVFCKRHSSLFEDIERAPDDINSDTLAGYRHVQTFVPLILKSSNVKNAPSAQYAPRYLWETASTHSWKKLKWKPFIENKMIGCGDTYRYLLNVHACDKPNVLHYDVCFNETLPLAIDSNDTTRYSMREQRHMPFIFEGFPMPFKDQEKRYEARTKHPYWFTFAASKCPKSAHEWVDRFSASGTIKDNELTRILLQTLTDPQVSFDTRSSVLFILDQLHE